MTARRGLKRIARILACLCLAACADARAQPAPPPAPVAQRAADAFRYQVEVRAPEAVRDAIAANVDLVRWRDYADMTHDLFDRLARDATRQARDTLEALGYFDARIALQIDREADPAAVTLAIEPGEPVEIREARVIVTGPAQGDEPAGGDAIRKAQGEWLLKRGTQFSQQRWDEAKARAVAAIAASPYAAARIVASEARIDPAARSADLMVEIDSGPRFYFGTLEIRGLARYPESLVRNYSTIVAGTPYSRGELDQFVRRLNGSGYFASVHATIDADPANAAAAPVTVAVIEAPPKRLEAGFGYSTDTGFSASASYSDVDFDRAGLQFYADGRLDEKIQSLALRFVRPPTATGWLDSFTAQAERTDIENLVTKTASFGMRREDLDERDKTAWIGTFYFDRQEPVGADDVTSHALYLALDRSWRVVDDLVAPRRGFVVTTQLGGGVPGASTRGFGRAIVKYASWHPIGRASSLDLRAEGGAVFAPTRQGIPSTLLFRTGGDTTVRGYAYQSLGVPDGDAIVGGRYYLVASAEVMRWFGDNWGLAAFVDAGNAADEPSQLGTLAVGYGIGGRYRTPIGPFRLDLAYGQRDRSVRLHFSVGLAF